MTVYVEYKGEKITLPELSERTGLKYKTLYARLFTNNWNPEIAITTPLTTPRAYKKILQKQEIKQKLNGTCK